MQDLPADFLPPIARSEGYNADGTVRSGKMAIERARDGNAAPASIVNENNVTGNRSSIRSETSHQSRWYPTTDAAVAIRDGSAAPASIVSEYNVTGNRSSVRSETSHQSRWNPTPDAAVAVAERSSVRSDASHQSKWNSAVSDSAVVMAMPDDPSLDAEQPEETYFIDQETGKPMVTRIMNYKGRAAVVTVELASDGHVKQIVTGSAKLPEETNRHYFRQMSSFALWQLRDTPGTKGISWKGDQKYAWWCMAVIVVDLVLLIVEFGLNHWQIEPFAHNPMFGPKAQVLLDMGAKRADLILKGEYQRLIAPFWLHGGIIHYIINMIALYGIGFSLEKEFGTPKIAIIFLVCGFVGNLASAVFVPNAVGVGASGAIFGLFGAAWSDLIQNWGLYTTRGNAKMVLCQLIFGTVLNVALGLAPILDQFAHLGGMFCGISMGFVLLLQKRFTRFGEAKPFNTKHRVLQLFGLLTVPASIIAMLIALFRGVDPNGWCAWCKYINCVPIPGVWICDDTGCSTDPTVTYTLFPNSTLSIRCPLIVHNQIYNVVVSATPSSEDAIRFCQAGCFP